MKAERKEEILSLIQETGYVSVEQLSKKLYISPSSIRRNLAELEKQGYIKRSYGGAALYEDGSNAPLKLRLRTNHKQKDLIARKAAAHLRDDMVVFIDGSSTCLHMVPYLQKFQNLTVYTNGIELCTLLGQERIPVYTLGGQLIPNSLAFGGEYAIAMAKSLYFDALFLSCGGADEHLITDYSLPESQLRRVLTEQAGQVYILCDSSKLGKRYPYIICKKSEITEFICDE